MRIYSMTATFGKLENQSLTLEPGLNVITAPNEWGKSTWCAFLLNMLYGIDTKERTKLDSIADKDRYAPWSGSPMSGKIDLCWNGKDITIERSSNQRVPLGNFRAYETATGIDIPELTAANCGQTLLGVERNVFVRAGFLKLADLPVTQDDALRRRLNNLVTTGDESNEGDNLRQALRDLKNKCRSNRANGLIPEAEAQRTKLQNQLWELKDLQEKQAHLESSRADLEYRIAALENHKCVLRYDAAQKDARQVSEANQNAQTAQERVESLLALTATLPSQDEAQKACQEAEQLQAEANLLLQRQLAVPKKPVCPATPVGFENIPPQQAEKFAQADVDAYNALLKKQKKATSAATISAVHALLALGAMAVNVLLSTAFMVPVLIGGGVVFIGGFVLAIVSLSNREMAKKEIDEIILRHPGQTPEGWLLAAKQYAATMADYESKLSAYNLRSGDFTKEQEQHKLRLRAFAGEQTLSQKYSYYENALHLWQELTRAQQQLQQARDHAQALASMAKTAPKPIAPDPLTYTASETDSLLAEANLLIKQTAEQAAQTKGRMEALGQGSAIQAKLSAVNRRISRLETYNAALDLAQDALYKTTLALQRRFSPRITKAAQELFSRLTDGRYQRITLGSDMSLQTATADEVTLQELRRRSDGTVDQLYLALRLAVARQLTPHAPLVLDDALVRFDDVRLKSAMDILKEESENKQVILFTCHGREKFFL